MLVLVRVAVLRVEGAVVVAIGGSLVSFEVVVGLASVFFARGALAIMEEWREGGGSKECRLRGSIEEWRGGEEGGEEEGRNEGVWAGV